MSRANSCVAILLFLAILFSAPAISLGDFAASDYVGGGTLGNFDLATGWSFAPKQNLVVRSLGVYDRGTLGFTDSHDVGIFRSSDFAAIATTSLASGLSGTFIPGTVQGTRVTPITLLSGVNYYILSNNFSSDQFAFGTTAVTYAPELTWTGFVDASANSIFSTPIFYSGFPGNTGPNFTFVPEPSTFVLTGLAVLSTFGFGRKRK